MLCSCHLVAQMVKNLPAMQETQVRSLDQEDSPGEENDDPLQYSCLENCVDRPWDCKASDVTEQLTPSLSLF